MVKLKKALIGLSTILVFLLGLGIASAAVTITNLEFEVDTTTLETGTVYWAGTDVVTGEHGTTLTGSFDIRDILVNADTVIASIVETGKGTTNPLPTGAGAFTFTFTPSTPTLADGAPGTSQTISYTVEVPAYTSPGTYEGEITVTDSATPTANTTVFDIEVVVNTDNKISITETTITDDVVLGQTGTVNFTLENTGNIPQTVSLTMTELEANWKNSEKIGAVIITSVVVPANSTVAGSNAVTASFDVATTTTGDKYAIYTGTLTASVAAGAVTDTAALVLNTVRDTDSVIPTVDNIDVEDLTGDDDELRPGDIITVDDLEIGNSGSNFILQDVEVDVTLYKVSSGKKYEDITIEVDEIDEDDTVDETFEIQIPYDAPRGDYILEFYVVGENADTPSEKHSALFYSSVLEVQRDSRHVVVESITESASDSLVCEDTTQVSVKVTNIGTRDIESDDTLQLKVTVDTFDFEETISIDELKEDKSETHTVSINIPSNQKKGTFILTAELTYKADDSDDGRSASHALVIDECSTTSSSTTQGTVALLGDETGSGNVGESIKYTLTVTNDGDSTADYTVDVSGATDWATVTIEPAGSLRLSPGQTTTLFVYLTPMTSASGANAATVNVQSAGTTVATKSLTAAVSGSTTVTTFTQSTLSDFNASTVVLYTSVIMNLLLIMVMIGGIHVIKKPQPSKKKKRN